MFNLFKKEKLKEAILNKENIINELPKIAAKLYPKEVLEIHHEFSIASENLLKEAQSTIPEISTKDVSKVNRLEALGFKQAGQVTELKPLIQKAELSKDQLELVKYYQREYPLNRFITEEQVKAICHKWNLVCGEVNRFKGFVPEKNLKEIENFKLKDSEKDMIELENTCVEDWKIGVFKKSDFDDCGEYIFAGKASRPNMTPALEKVINKALSMGIPANHLFVKRCPNKDFTLQICAPIKDMDTKGMEIKDGYMLRNIPDPVVLHPIIGGFLILTCWGPESADENVVNSINN